MSLIPELRAHENNEILGNDWIIGRCAVNNSGIILEKPWPVSGGLIGLSVCVMVVRLRVV